MGGLAANFRRWKSGFDAAPNVAVSCLDHERTSVPMPKETSPVRKDPRLGNGDIGSGQSRHDPRAIVAACSRQNAIYAAQASRLDRQRHCEFVFPEASLHDKIRLVELRRELHSRHGTMQRDRCTGVVNAFYHVGNHRTTLERLPEQEGDLPVASGAPYHGSLTFGVSMHERASDHDLTDCPP